MFNSLLRCRIHCALSCKWITLPSPMAPASMESPPPRLNCRASLPDNRSRKLAHGTAYTCGSVPNIRYRARAASIHARNSDSDGGLFRVSLSNPPSIRIHGDDLLDGAVTDGAECVIAREHNAVFLRPVVAFRRVIRPFESAYTIGILIVR